MIDPASKDETDPFVIGQIVGMLVILTFIENNNGINKELLFQLKRVCAEKTSQALAKPAEDIHLMAEELAKNIK